MAKRFKVLDVRAVEGGAILDLERLGERFELPIQTAGLPALIALLAEVMDREALRVPARLVDMALKPNDAGAEAALKLEGWPAISFPLD